MTLIDSTRPLTLHLNITKNITELRHTCPIYKKTAILARLLR